MRPVMVRPMLFSLAEAASVDSGTVGHITAHELGVLDARQSSGSTTVTTPRFNELRLVAVEAWGADLATSTTGSANSLSITIVESTNNLTGGDGAVYRDYGTFGSDRPNIRVTPNLNLREQWLSTSADTEGDSAIFLIQTAQLVDFVAPGDNDVLVRATLHLR